MARHFRATLLLLTALLLTAGAPLLAQRDGAKPDIGLTEEEQAWIAAHPVIRAGHDTSFSPYALRDEAGRIVGIDPDFLELIARRTGLKFVHEDRHDWPAMLTAFRAGEVDILGSMGTAPERESYMNYTKAYTLAPNVIITRNDAPYLFDIRDLAGKTVSRPRGYVGLKDDLDLLAPGHLAVEYSSSLECYQAVARGEVFASIGDLANAAYLIKSHRLVNLRLGSVTTDSSEIYFAIRKDWPELVSIVNKVVASLTPMERQEINNRWIAVDMQAPEGWVLAFNIAAGIVAVVIVVFLVAVWHNRRLARELEERRRIQRQLEETRDALAAISEEKSHLLSTVAHDLRGPLTGIILGADFIRTLPEKGPVGPAIAAAERIRAATNQMITMTNELLTVQRIEAGRFELTFAPADAAAVVRASVQSFTPTAAQKGIRFSVQLPPTGVQLETDAGAFQQVVDNLVSNAVKYSGRGTEVTITLEADAVGCTLRVQDQGPGIKAEETELIFTQYGRGSAQPTGGETSIGLGLWIVRRLATDLRGTVRVESEPGAGAVFVVWLPLRPGAAVK